MIERPTAWPDGRPLGGLNGYPPEWHAWAEECQIKYVARQMLAAPKEQRKAVHERWIQIFPHATPERIKAVWDQVVSEKRQGAK
ncbi:hypothetical protein HW452_05245 [Halomonas aquamarina]|uniref:Uncharacterized protein n=1 Tax=Vreelandella aquamarina TaxID=77097 RepID=A0ACC5VTE1_9GAMM|nr:hypothetical protein [Halomonas aquamarina]MBZ5486927.1 hypothetical protein [Halomonas aquamarina]